MEKEKGLKLFGFNLYAAVAEEENEIMRKSKSLGDLHSCDADQNQRADNGYLSDGDLIHNSRSRIRAERKRGVPWSEEEHRTFLAGLEQLGKGDWKGISRNFVPTRTPTQVASHAQKYFLRQSNPNKRRRRSSLFDVGINDHAALNHSEISSEIPAKQIDAAPERINASNVPPMIYSQANPLQLEAPLKLPFLSNYNCTHSTHSLTDMKQTCNSEFFSNANYPKFLQLSL